MTKTESAEHLIKTLVIESCEQLLDFHGAEGVRAAIPNTNNLVMVGTPEWIAKNVPGVEAMTGRHTEAVSRAAECVESYGRDDLAVLLREVAAALASQPQAEPVGEFAGYLDGIVPVVDWVKGSMPKVGDKLYVAATTQASTAQAERVPEGWKLVPIKPTDEMARAGYYALPEPAQDVNAEICWDAMLAAAPVTTTSSTDAQAAAEVRDALHLAEDALTSCLRGGYTDVDGDYVRTFSFDADKVDAALRALRAGDTGGAR